MTLNELWSIASEDNEPENVTSGNQAVVEVISTRRPLGLLDVPPEFRLTIFRHLLIAPNGLWLVDWSGIPRPPVDILRSSRVIYREALEVFYGENREVILIEINFGSEGNKSFAPSHSLSWNIGGCIADYVDLHSFTKLDLESMNIKIFIRFGNSRVRNGLQYLPRSVRVSHPDCHRCLSRIWDLENPQACYQGR